MGLPPGPGWISLHGDSNRRETGTWPQNPPGAAAAPVPLEAIEEMAALCMRDPDDEEEEADEELEDEADLLVRRGRSPGRGDFAPRRPPLPKRGFSPAPSRG